MLLNWLERAAVNNPLRSALQRYLGAKKLIRLGSAVTGGHVLEIGCGRGIGAGIALNDFGATSVDAFDLDSKMVERAKNYLKKYGDKAHVWVGDASAISVPDSTYDAVLDFGIIHHVPEWRQAIREIHRVLKPGGRFYGEEVLRAWVQYKKVATDIKSHWTQCNFLRSIQTHGLAIKNTRALCNRSAGK